MVNNWDCVVKMEGKDEEKNHFYATCICDDG